MHSISKALVATISGLVLAAGLTAVAAADDHAQGPAEPCARREAQVAKAEDALARVTAVFERKQQATEVAEEDLAEATGSEKAAARKQLAEAKSAEATAKKAKKAQQQRLAKAQQRLADCEAAQEPTDEPTGEPTDEPTETPAA